MMLLVTTLIASLLPKTTATPSPVKIDSIDPNSGPVGTTVRVIGEIDTPGSYSILFDGEEVKNGTVVGTAVNDTFKVPLCVRGNHNVTLYDVTNDNQSLPATFNVITSYYVTAEPARIQEGLNTTITVSVDEAEANATYTFTINVTDPQPIPASYTATLTVSTNATGSGFNSTLYYENFSVGANTNYVGTYAIAVMDINETLTTGNFTVGLTDKLDYRRTEIVDIRGAGYNANKNVTINIATAGASVVGYPKNITADLGGIVTDSWNITIGNTAGTYTVTLTNATMGTVKPVPDVQNFWIERIFIDPTSGRWRTTVRVVGRIVTSNGTYQILWDGKNVKEAIGQSDGAVNDTFIVPPSVKGYHNVTLRDVNQTTESMPATFEVTTSCYVLAEPARIPEGTPPGPTLTVGVREAEANATYIFTIKVTDPLNWNWTAKNILVTTNGDGLGKNSTVYPSTYTNYTGTYRITVNATLASGSFTVSLTNEPEYRVTNKVWIQGSGYRKEEIVTVDITNATGVSVIGYPKNVTAGTDGIVGDAWTIPEDADLGIYAVTLSNATTPGTVKPIPDIQNFTVIEIIVYCQARNRYDKEPLPDVTINVTNPYGDVASGKTNETGLIDFRIDRGNYTFKAVWKNEPVGTLENQSVTGEAMEYVLQRTFNITCELAQITIAINDEDGHPLPFINVTLANATLAPQTIVDSFETNYMGIVATNTFTNTSYTIEARRYGHLFNMTPIENLTVTRWINITCPTYTLFVHVLDSNGLPLQNVQVEVYEWSSERVTGPKTTDELGSVSLDCTFGRYKIKVYNYSAELKRTVVLNETVMDLIEDPFFFVIHCKISNLDLSVLVVDYFGQPIPNAKVKVEREFEEGYVNIANLKTGSDGTVSLPKIGGNYRISVYVTGKLCETKTLHLDESKVIKFKIDKFVVVGGHPLEVTQLVACISLGILVALFGLALMYRRLRPRKVREGKEKSL